MQEKFFYRSPQISFINRGNRIRFFYNSSIQLNGRWDGAVARVVCLPLSMVLHNAPKKPLHKPFNGGTITTKLLDYKQFNGGTITTKLLDYKPFNGGTITTKVIYCKPFDGGTIITKLFDYKQFNGGTITT